MFPEATVWLGATEMDWAEKEPPGGAVPELYVEALGRSPKLRKVEDGQEILPGLVAHLAPGHTPGCVVYVLSGRDHDVVFSGDAAKNRAELLSRQADLTLDAAMSSLSIERILDLWRERPGSVLVPGHDVPMVLESGAPRYLDRREAAITAWYGDTLDQTTRFALTLE
jgi:glyoxylase-like metal-dependent hydrolase (beta-lactamase superfamily II)